MIYVNEFIPVQVRPSGNQDLLVYFRLLGRGNTAVSLA